MQAASGGAGSRSAEAWGSFWSGVFEGDFSDNDSWSKTGGQVLVGLVPWVGQAADARDTLAALDQVRQGRPGAWLGLLAAGVAWVPGAGDALKGAIRGGRKVAGEATEAAIEQATKHVGTDAAEEAAETAAHGTSPAEVTGTIAPKKSRWDYIVEYHDKRATEIFGEGKGRRLGDREYDKHYKGHDVEYKSDNFTKRPRETEELRRMENQLNKDVRNMKLGRSNPHWHFENDPRVAPEMKPLLERMEANGVAWTYGPKPPF